MSKNQRKGLEIGLALAMFGLFLLIMPWPILHWLLAIPGVISWWVIFLMVSWYFTTELDEWIDDD